MNLRTTADRIGIGVIGGLTTAVILALLGLITGEPFPASRLVAAAVLGAIAISALVALLVRRALVRIVARWVRPRIEHDLRPIIAAEVTRSLERDTGIARVYSNFPECEQEILTQIASSSDVRIFLQIGKTVLSGVTDIYDYLAKANLRPGANVKVLHASPHSRYLSERVAANRGSDYQSWSADLDHARRKVGSLMSKAGAHLEGREHEEGYLWRLFVFEDVAYAQPYLYKKDNSASAPVYRFSRTISEADGRLAPNPKSMYNLVSEYFEQKWAENTPRITTLADLIPSGSSTAVAVVAKYHQFYVFVVPRRYLQRDAREVPFHGIGGKLHEGEDWIAGLRREIREEVGIDVEIESCKETRYLTSGLEIEAIHVTDEPKPYCVYKRSRETDPNFAHPDVLWLVGYRAQMNVKGFLKPRAETAALLYLTGDMLKATMHERLSFRQINQAADGSRVILGADVDLDLDRRAVPSGLALIAAASTVPRLLRGL